MCLLNKVNLWHTNHLVDFKTMAKNKSVSKNTIVFNNLVTNIAEFNENWEVPASDSWHSRFIK